MELNKTCVALPGHTKFIDNRTVFPVVVSAKRFDAIMGRSRMDKKHADLAAAEEERRYMQYLKEGSDWVCSHFTNVGAQTMDEAKKAKLDQELKEAAILEQQVRLEDAKLRKERIIRANRILEDLKAGQRALHHAAVESEVIHQRRYNEAVNREILEDALRQQRLDEKQCSEALIPFCSVTEEQEKAKEQEKSRAFRTYLLTDIEERRKRRLAEKEQEECDIIVDRAQYKCLHDVEKKAAEELAKKKREFCCRAYHDALKEKADIKKYESMCDQIDDRVICVDTTRRRNLDARYSKTLKAMIANKIKAREDRAIQLCRMQQANKRNDQELQDNVQERYETEVQMDEGRRQCQLEDLSKQRRAYELEERKQNEESKQRMAQIRRYNIAERFKNQQTNKLFYNTQRQQHNKATADLRNILNGQREEFLKQRQDELMRMTACQEDPNLKEDVMFFQDAVKMMTEARKVGRPVFPMATAVEFYRRKNQIDMVPEGRSVGRSRLRDYCWPGYFSKADLAYRKYEHREKCRQEQEKDRHSIFANCIKITKMAAEEQPYKECDMEIPMKCFQHRGLPAIESVDSFDCGCNKCFEDAPLLGPIAMDVKKISENNLQANIISNPEFKVNGTSQETVKPSTINNTSRDLGSRTQSKISKTISGAIGQITSKVLSNSKIRNQNSDSLKTEVGVGGRISSSKLSQQSQIRR
ncbi:myosin-10 [Drosophila grimshawi]|uniref:GH20996 n=1 Tax=Drosophila grimshawi TaxID=7222 RepID=B4J4V8_DROGR|nr:myosin-10 [Drosophila grimshawi]EDW00654.1 GH20996 [Drosophila grimshawi]